MKKLNIVATLLLVGCGASVSAVPPQPAETPSSRSSPAQKVKQTADGSGPVSALAFDAAGALYGTTTAGGSHNWGTVFKLTPTASGYSERVIHNFTGRDGADPKAGVILDSGGALYGTTSGGGYGWGTVFKLTPSGSRYRESVLHAFQNKPDGAYPDGGLIFGAAGALYGTTSAGGSDQRGTVFELTPSGSQYREHILYSFESHLLRDGVYDAKAPDGNLLIDSKGALFGTSSYGGGNDPTYGWGTVFQVAPARGRYSERLLYEFTGGADGGHPSGGLISDRKAALYGVTPGGYPSAGAAFELTPAGSKYSFHILDQFAGNDGYGPAGGLIFGAPGVLYGTTTGEGSYRAGTAFESQRSSGGYVVRTLYTFTGGTDGEGPLGALISDKTGALYGTTLEGGSPSCSCGTVFKLTPSESGYTESVLHAFTGGSGSESKPLGKRCVPIRWDARL